MQQPSSEPHSITEAHRLVREARHLLLTGNREAARRLAERAAAAAPQSVDPWLFLAYLDSAEQSVAHARHALQIDPSSSRAQQALVWAQSRLSEMAPSPAPGWAASPAPGLRETASTVITKPFKPARHHNWPLIFGTLIVGFILGLALIGPRFAPHDPMQERYVIIMPDRELLKPPLAAFRLPEFPLGLDDYGRDILSRLLYGTGPTLRIVLLVASVRLFAGIIIGLWAGWSNRLVGRILEQIIAACLAVPVLFVALFFIAATGLRLGSSAFIIGLFITGWAESARLIREQARLIKSQPYIEAALALGASARQIIINHILPHITPLVWILLAFEISSSLLTLAGLGFLGYYINAIWMPYGDWTAIRATGKPELGQMLAVASGRFLQHPWTLLAAGALIIIMVLGFNLLGDGLRLQLQLDMQRRRKGVVGQTLGQASSWLEERWFSPTSRLRRYGPTFAAAGTILVLIVAGVYYVYSTRAATAQDIAVSIPGGHAWATQSHDAQSTRWTSALGPQDPVLTWSFSAEGGFQSGPVVSADGSIYISAQNGMLYSLAPDGSLRWQYTLPAIPVGSPALGSGVDVYITDIQGRLLAIDPLGVVRWEFMPPNPTPALDGPAVASDGTIYYPTQDYILAVAPDGKLLWQNLLPTYSYTSARLRLSWDNQYVFFEDTAVNPANGEIVLEPTFDASDRWVVGVDGSTYLGARFDIKELVIGENGLELQPRGSMDARALGLGNRTLRDAGVTPDHYYWFLYSSGFEFNRVIWLDPQGELLNPVDYPFTETGAIIGIDGNNIMYACGSISLTDKLECRANRAGAPAPLWSIQTPLGIVPTGGAIVPGRLYVATADGYLLALADETP